MRQTGPGVPLLVDSDKRSQAVAISKAVIDPREEAAMRKTKAPARHRERLIEELRNSPQLAAHYLKEAIDDEGPRALLAALRTVIEVRGIARVAEAAKIPRESLYRTLSPKGNPRLSTLLAVIKAAGFKIALSERKRPAAYGSRRLTVLKKELGENEVLVGEDAKGSL